ncbi:hypothetical protein [Oscillibacter sp.]|uniref:hypothetical protein n=1 Tax=Oscillibacter sp. TaxID=1945593 RepID=UPI0025F24D57|nr:hypothetical protein [Oscillibacter sp.]
MEKYQLNDVYGITRDVPLNYVERGTVDNTLLSNLNRKRNITIFGSSKQGKTCLRKHCLAPNSYIVVQCSNRWQLADLNANILKRAGYEITASNKTTIGGNAKVTASLSGKFFGLYAGVSGEEGTVNSQETVMQPLELDMEDVNDVIDALKQINFCNYIILEDFHYLKTEVQKDFAIELKAFHENSNLCFIIIGVWLDENKLAIYNGDLTGRLIPINADSWNDAELRSVITSGEKLLNIKFDEAFISALLKESNGNVYIVQEACYYACNMEGITETQEALKSIGESLSAREIVLQIVNGQSGRYNTFLTSYANGFQDTALEMHKWLLYPVLTAQPDMLMRGLSYRYIREVLEKNHPKRDTLNPGNITQALQSVASLQLSKSIQPIIMDYDASNLKLHIVDRGFIIWLNVQNRNELLSEIGLPETT